GIDDEIGAGDEESVAVRRRLRRAASADISAGAGDVVDVELRTRLFGQLVRHQAGEHVGRTGRREWDDHAYRPHRIALRGARARSEHGGSGGEMQKPATGQFHLGPSGSDGAGTRRAPHQPYSICGCTSRRIRVDLALRWPDGDVSGLTM